MKTCSKLSLSSGKPKTFRALCNWSTFSVKNFASGYEKFTKRSSASQSQGKDSATLRAKRATVEGDVFFWSESVPDNSVIYRNYLN